MNKEVLQQFKNKTITVTTNNNLVFRTNNFEFDEDQEAIYFNDKYNKLILIKISDIKLLMEVSNNG